MASAFDTSFLATSWPGLVRGFGVSVSYSAGGAAAKTIDWVEDAGLDQRTDLDNDGQVRKATRSGWISTDATAGIASPADGDTVTLDGDVYVVDRVLEQVAGLARLQVQRSERRTAGPRGHVLSRNF